MRNCTARIYWESDWDENDQLDVLCDFKENVVRIEDGGNEIGFHWILEQHYQKQTRHFAESV